MRTFVCPETKEEKRNGPPEREVRRAQGGDETVGVRTACCFRKKATAGFSKEGGTFSPATCSIITTLESLMFGTWASYESTRAFVTSSFLWQRRGSDFQTAALAAWQPSNRFHIPQAPTGSNNAIQQKARAAFYFNWADDTPFVGDLANTPNTRKTYTKRAQWSAN